ncbi:MAG: hypothetical protein Q9166_001621 [cf. Caloplaca sp. 2 TL-2023]
MSSTPRHPGGMGYDPLGVVNMIGPTVWNCCGGCALRMEGDEILYFSTAPTPECSKAPPAITSDGTSYSSSVTPNPIEGREITTGPSNVVVDGSTLTFPSIYMVIPGTVYVQDQCGTLGNVYYHVTIPIKPGGLSSLSFHASVLAAWDGQTAGSFDPALPASCRAYGAADPIWTTMTQSYDNTTITATSSFVTISPPYWPILSPPVELLEYDPKWKASCPYWHTNGAAPEATSGSSVSSTHGSRFDPVQTIAVDKEDPQEPVDQGTPLSKPDHSVNMEPSNTDSRPDFYRTETDPSSQPEHPSSKDPYEFHKRPVYNVGGETVAPGGPAVTVKGVRYSLDASAAALLSSTKTIPPGPQTNMVPEVTIGRQTVSVNSASMYVIGKQTLSPNDPAVTVSGTSYSLAESATAIIAGGSTVSLETPQTDPPINGNIYSANTRPHLKFKGSEIVAGGPTVTISKTRYALDPSATALYAGSRTLAVSFLIRDESVQTPSSNSADNFAIPMVVGSSTTYLPTPTNANNAIITINSTPYTANTSFFVIGTQTLIPGSPAMTVNSTPYSLPPLSATLTSYSFRFVSVTKMRRAPRF